MSKRMHIVHSITKVLDSPPLLFVSMTFDVAEDPAVDTANVACHEQRYLVTYDENKGEQRTIKVRVSDLFQTNRN